MRILAIILLLLALLCGCAPAGLLWERESRPDGTVREKSEIQIPPNTEDVRAPEVGPAGARMGRLKTWEIKSGTWILYLAGALMVAGGALLYFGFLGVKFPVPGLALAGTGLGVILIPTVLPALGTIFIVALVVALGGGGVWGVSTLLEKRRVAKEEREWEASIDRQMAKLLGEALDGNEESASAYKALYRVRHPEAQEILSKASDLKRALAIS